MSGEETSQSGVNELLSLYKRDLETALGRRGWAYSAMLEAIDTFGASTLGSTDAQTWVWSDLHLGHARILQLSPRPFKTVGEMDAFMWNSVYKTVPMEDHLVCVGDFAFNAARTEETWSILRAHPHTNTLVIGNHDLGRDGSLLLEGFSSISALTVAPGTPPLVFTHVALPEVPEGFVNVHGHQHAQRQPHGSRHINVSVEQLDYEPVRLTRIRSLAALMVRGEEPPEEKTIDQLNWLSENC